MTYIKLSSLEILIVNKKYFAQSVNSRKFLQYTNYTTINGYYLCNGNIPGISIEYESRAMLYQTVLLKYISLL